MIILPVSVLRKRTSKGSGHSPSIIRHTTTSVQQKETLNIDPFAELSSVPSSGTILAIDPGTKRCGLAVCDPLQITTRPLPYLIRTSWKKLLSHIKDLVREFDARALVVGLPLETDGSENEMSVEARSMAQKLSLSLSIPVFLQDERCTSYEARGRIWGRGVGAKTARKMIDSEAAAIILADFLDRVRQTNEP